MMGDLAALGWFFLAVAAADLVTCLAERGESQ